jgi:hypothetical protein
MLNKVSTIFNILELRLRAASQSFRQMIPFPRNSLYKEIRYFESSAKSRQDLVAIYGNFGEYAIVIQGPLNKKSKDLFESIERYFSLYPGIQIVLSTWSFSGNRKVEIVLKNTKEKHPRTFHILESAQISNSGISNINSQIHTTYAGLQLCRTLGVRYVLKTRTDQSLNDPKFLLKLERAYRNRLEDIGRKPIILSSKNSFLFRPYSLSDMLQFSDLDTLLFFWGIDFDSRESLGDLLTTPKTLSEWSKHRLAEVYLICNYLEAKGEVLDFTLKHYHECLIKYFAIVDSDSLGHYWAKYSIRTNGEIRLYFPYPKYEISEFDYNQIREGKESYSPYEDKIKLFWE